jgi:hypothetical protein
MKKLTGALVLSFSLLLACACRRSGETKNPEDASTPAGAVDAARGALNNGSGEAGKPAPGVDVGGMKSDSGSGSTMGTGAAAPSGSSGGATVLPDDTRAAQESCLDRWLSMRKMDKYGHPEGTMYAGGSPLFNEQTGEMTDRLEYVYKRQPMAKDACANAGKK